MNLGYFEIPQDIVDHFQLVEGTSIKVDLKLISPNGTVVAEGLDLDMCSSILPKKTHDIAVCAIFQNQGLYLKEWIEYHGMQGVSHFFLYDHKSTDDSLDVLVLFSLR